MQAGKLRHYVKLQQNSAEQDAIGQPGPPVWVDVDEIWADIRYLTGIGAVRADADVTIAKCSIRIRTRDVSVGQRILEGTTAYHVKAVLPDPTGARYVDLVCETGANDG